MTGNAICVPGGREGAEYARRCRGGTTFPVPWRAFAWECRIGMLPRRSSRTGSPRWLTCSPADLPVNRKRWTSPDSTRRSTSPDQAHSHAAIRVRSWCRIAPVLSASRELPVTGGVPRAGHPSRNELSGFSAAGPGLIVSSRSSTCAHVLLHSLSGLRICSSTASCSSNEDS